MITKNKIIILVLSFLCIFQNGYADENNGNEQVEINKQLKKQLLNSKYKTDLYRNDGKKFLLYLYAEDEKKTIEEHISCSGKEYKTIVRRGHYYIYVYDVSSNRFFPNKIAVFKDTDEITMDVEGANFIVWRQTSENKSDILLMSQFVACNGNEYEAYGFVGNQLKKYIFSGKKKNPSFYGKIDIEGLQKHDNDLIGYSFYNEKLHQIKLSLSKVQGEIKLDILAVSRHPQFW